MMNVCDDGNICILIVSISVSWLRSCSVVLQGVTIGGNKAKRHTGPLCIISFIACGSTIILK